MPRSVDRDVSLVFPVPVALATAPLRRTCTLLIVAGRRWRRRRRLRILPRVFRFLTQVRLFQVRPPVRDQRHLPPTPRELSRRRRRLLGLAVFVHVVVGGLRRRLRRRWGVNRGRRRRAVRADVVARDRCVATLQSIRLARFALTRARMIRRHNGIAGPRRFAVLRLAAVTRPKAQAGAVAGRRVRRARGDFSARVAAVAISLRVIRWRGRRDAGTGTGRARRALLWVTLDATEAIARVPPCFLLR